MADQPVLKYPDHDSLCEMNGNGQIQHCRCSLIALVRHEERRAAGWCSQCGQGYLEPACGPTHAAIAHVALHPTEADRTSVAQREALDRIRATMHVLDEVG